LVRPRASGGANDVEELATSRFSRLLSCDSTCAADSTCEEAEPVSDAPRCMSATFSETLRVPRAVSCTLREISCVALPCCSTAAEMVVEKHAEQADRGDGHDLVGQAKRQTGHVVSEGWRDRTMEAEFACA
jgi:hypothetical protein